MGRFIYSDNRVFQDKFQMCSAFVAGQLDFDNVHFHAVGVLRIAEVAEFNQAGLGNVFEIAEVVHRFIIAVEKSVAICFYPGIEGLVIKFLQGRLDLDIID